MLDKIMNMLGWLYTLVAILLSIFSANMLVLTLLYWVRRLLRKPEYQLAQTQTNEWPQVTVQLPIYNEPAVAVRLIDAVVGLNYPLDRLEIQVLDDSTDETQELVRCRAAYWQSRGRDIKVLHRAERVEFKAGALREGLASAKGDFIAIFDADFIPPPCWLKNALLPFFEPGSEMIGLVQTRWSHINEDYSLLTRAQALALDGHFGIEQNVRHEAGLFINFNGTAGIWRKQCILDAGNWRGASLSEDLDISYRAQILGWRVRFLRTVTAPAELPTLMVGFKRQQFRWSKGSIQAVRMLAPNLLRSPVGFFRKLHGLLHMTGYLTHPLMLLLLLMTLPLTLWGIDIMERLPLGWLGIIGLGLPLFYGTSQYILKKDRFWIRRLLYLPVLSMLFVGIAVNNTRAVIEAFTRKTGVFERTPKTGASDWKKAKALGISERFKMDPSVWFELFLGIYALVTSLTAVGRGNIAGAVFYTLYAGGFLWVATSTLWETRETIRLGLREMVLRRARN